MSLNYNLSKVESFNELLEDDPSCPGETRLKAFASSIIQMTMVVGMGEITALNSGTFWRRLSIVQGIYGACLSMATADGPVPIYVTREDVVRMIGLRCNVSHESPTKWERRMGAAALARASERTEHEIEKQKEAGR